MEVWCMWFSKVYQLFGHYQYYLVDARCMQGEKDLPYEYVSTLVDWVNMRLICVRPSTTWPRFVKMVGIQCWLLILSPKPMALENSRKIIMCLQGIIVLLIVVRTINR